MYNSWKLLWPFVKPYKGQLIFALFMGLLLAVMGVTLPLLAKLIILGFEQKPVASDPNFIKIIDFFGWSQGHWVYSLNPKSVVQFAAFSLPVYYLLSGLVRYTHFFMIKYISDKIIADIRMALMNKFMELDVLYVGRQDRGSGGLLSRTLNDTLILQMGLQYYADLAREPIAGLFMVGLMFFINWKITLGCLIFLPIFAAVIGYVTKSLKKFGYQSQEALEEVTKTLKEGIDGVRVIQSFNLQEPVKNKFRQQVMSYLHKKRKIIKREELGSPINEWFAAVMVCGICLFQAEQIWGNQSSVSSFIAFLFAGGMLDKPVKKTQQAVIRIQQNVVAMERLNEVLTSPTEVIEPQNPVEFPKNWSEIEFQGVNFSYKDKPAVSDINLSIKRGEVIALVGESGSGKSTIAGLLQRFFDPQLGEIKIGDVPVKDMGTKDLRQNIGYVTQDVFLFDESIEDNIWFGNLKRDKADIPAAAEMANASKFINETGQGFLSRVGERGSRLSGGEKQRLSIARAVFKDPPILILDEATSALDSASEQEVQKGIETLLKGRTALVIAHRLSTIVNSDRIIVMKDGRIVEEGTHQSLIKKNQEYARFYKLQYT